jgi:hypothetical protein
VRRIAEEPDLSRRLGENGRALAARYLREDHVDALEQVLERARLEGRR